jgi:hypothetical protein
MPQNRQPKGTCLHCLKLIGWSQLAAYEITGYEIERKQGGANQIVERKRVDKRMWHLYNDDGINCFNHRHDHERGEQPALPFAP